MQRCMLISVASFLIGSAFADVLVQPGYGQPQALSNLNANLPPPPNYRHIENYQHVNPGYHLELHPVYGNLGHSDSGLAYLHSNDLSPYLSRAAQRRLYSGKLGTVGIPLTHSIVQPHYIPLAVHSRNTRSISDEPVVGIREKRGEVDVATKSSLNGEVPEVVRLPLQGGEEKRVEVRQSKNDETEFTATLLGLNPKNMNPAQNEYQIAKAAMKAYEQANSEPPKMQSQPNTRSAVEAQATPQNQAAISTQNIFSNMIPDNSQNALLLYPTYRLSGTPQTTVQDQQRNFPDPRPIAIQSLTQGDRNKSKNPAKSQDASNLELRDDKETVGSSRHHTVKTTFHAHQHPSHIHYRNSAIGEGYFCTCSNPSYVIHNNNNDGVSSGLGLTRSAFQQPAQVYQVYQQGYSPNSGYVVLPQTYSNYDANYDVNYDSGYPVSPTETYYVQEASSLAY